MVCRQPVMHSSACRRYALIVLRADDNGQGGAFALFSLLKRQAELGKKGKVRAMHYICAPVCQKEPPILHAVYHPTQLRVPYMQVLMSERNLSQYTIGRGSTSIVKRLSFRKGSRSMPPAGLPTLKEDPPAQLNDWRQRFVEVGQLRSLIFKGSLESAWL